jgi:hypothetical protein
MVHIDLLQQMVSTRFGFKYRYGILVKPTLQDQYRIGRLLIGGWRVSVFQGPIQDPQYVKALFDPWLEALSAS